MDVIAPFEFELRFMRAYWMMALAIIPVAMVEIWAAKREFSRELAPAIIVLMVTTVIFRLFAMGPHGGQLQSEFHELRIVRLIPPEAFASIVFTFGVIFLFLGLATTIGFLHGEHLPTALRLLAASPFIYYICHALVRMRTFEIEI